MPWPMVHFAVAVHTHIVQLSPSFLLGSIAPDAIHAREHVTREDKGITHFVYNSKLPSVEVLKTKCLEYLRMQSEPEWEAFVLGYFSHIYTDLRWTQSIYADFEMNYQGETKDIRRTYNQEVSQLEFEILRSGDWADAVLFELQTARAYSIEPLVTENEVAQYRDLKLEWLKDVNNEPKIEPIYFTEDRVNDFINRTAIELNEWLYEHFTVSGHDTMQR